MGISEGPPPFKISGLLDEVVDCDFLLRKECRFEVREKQFVDLLTLSSL